MVRVIKGRKGSDDATATQRASLVAKTLGGKARIIDKEVVHAQLQAAQLIKDGEHEKKRVLFLGRQKVAKAKEESMSKAATQAFAEVTKRILRIFLDRAQEYQNHAEDIRSLVQEIVKKILGVEPKMPASEIDELINNGMNLLRARRKLKLIFAKDALKKIEKDGGEFITQLQKMPEFELSEDAEINSGLMRVVSDVGSAMCAQDEVIEFLRKELSKMKSSS